jgi:hypothetical protein
MEGPELQAAVEDKPDHLRRNVHNHRLHCNVCNHKELKDIEADWIAGYSFVEIATKYNVPKYSIERHARYFKRLQDARDKNLVGHLDRFIAHGSVGSMHVDSPVYLKALALKMEARGIIKRGTVVNNTQTVNVAVVEETRQKNVETGLNRFRFTLKEDE